MKESKSNHTLNYIERYSWVGRLLTAWQIPRRSLMTTSFNHRIRESEIRLGCQIPNSIREWYAQFGDHGEFWSAQDIFLMPERIFIDRDLLVLITENQGVVQWGVPIDQLEPNADPQVALDLCDLGNEQYVENDSFSGFIQALALYNIKFSSDYVSSGKGRFNARIASALGVEQVGSWHWPKYPTNIFFNQDAIIEVQGSVSELCWVSLCSRNRALQENHLSEFEKHGIRLTSYG